MPAMRRRVLGRPFARAVLLLGVASCGYDWTVVPKDKGSAGSSTSSDGTATCGDVQCDPATSFCAASVKGTYECVPTKCASPSCSCGDIEGYCAGSCSDKGGLVVLQCK